jgi:hypothetical protein
MHWTGFWLCLTIAGDVHVTVAARSPAEKANQVKQLGAR